MRLRILDLDGSISHQTGIKERYAHRQDDLRAWGPRLRIACRFGRFARFERTLPSLVDGAEPPITLYGSGDFHHVTLAVLRQIRQPFNLLVVDKHPDWMRAIPFLHCGTWLYHAAQLPLVQRIFHVGGELDFDNQFRWLAPWSLLRSGKITVLPAIRSFTRGQWARISNEPVRPHPEEWITHLRLEQLLEPFRADLGRCPLYVSLDKDVMSETDAVVNWDSGYLALPEVEMILEAFLSAAHDRLAGMDIVGDWSPVSLTGVLRKFLHFTEHPPLTVDAKAAGEKNRRTNLLLLQALERQLEGRRQPVRIAA
jgi:hypothetical protein